MMTAIDLFAGAGGASLGLLCAGVDLVASYERCPRAADVHERLCGQRPRVIDLRDVVDMPRADLWWASPARGVDEPAMTIRCTSDVYLDGLKRRTLTVPERAALQALPYVEGMTGRQVGNAVPPPLAEALVRQVLALEVAR